MGEPADFSGYVTKAGLKCSDGRTIMPDAFKHMDNMQVPLVWQHGHDRPENVLGHVLLEARNDGMYGHAYFNDTPAANHSRLLVQHEDIKHLSIWANELIEKMMNGGKSVFHGMIREVSLVLAGANPGAKIDYVRVAHGDGVEETLTDEAVIHTGLDIELGDELLEHAADGATVQEIYDSLDEDQKAVVHYMIGVALENNTAHSAVDDKAAEVGAAGDGKQTEATLTHKEGTSTVTNVFETQQKTSGQQPAAPQGVLSHDAMAALIDSARNQKVSLKSVLEGYALQHGVDNLELLFPDHKNMSTMPEWNKRRTEWVAGVLNGVSKTPFSRIKSVVADLTQDEARAKGYIKGEYKKEEWFSLSKRTTGPTTVYKKQKIDRDDVIDITDFDVVAWKKGEMRLMLEEELACAILFGDGREVDDEDKIKDPMAASSGDGIRSIVNENELYATTIYVNIDDASSSMDEVVDSVIAARKYYKGTGTPTFYTTDDVLTSFMLMRDGFGRRMYRTVDELAAELRVSSIVAVEAMDRISGLVGIIVNLTDYNVGADKGGEVNLFDDFDIDYNQLKYLIETRISGALTKIKSALVIRKVASTDVVVVPNKPTFVPTTGVVTIVATTGVVYKDQDGNTLSTGAQAALDPGEAMTVIATPASGKYLANTASTRWTFTRNHA